MPQKTKNITYLLSLISVFIASFFISNPALAEEAGNSGFLGFDTSSPCAYWQSLFNFGMIAASILAVAMLVLGGIYYMTSLGQEDRIGNAKNIMTGAIVGFLIAISSWLIFNVLSPTLLECNLEVPEINVHYEESSGSDSNSDSGPNSASDPCASVSDDDLFDSEDDCNDDWEGVCRQIPREEDDDDESSSGGSRRSCNNAEDCLSGEECQGASEGVTGICVSGEETETTTSSNPRAGKWCRLGGGSWTDVNRLIGEGRITANPAPRRDIEDGIGTRTCSWMSSGSACSSANPCSGFPTEVPLDERIASLLVTLVEQGGFRPVVSNVVQGHGRCRRCENPNTSYPCNRDSSHWHGTALDLQTNDEIQQYIAENIPVDSLYGPAGLPSSERSQSQGQNCSSESFTSPYFVNNGRVGATISGGTACTHRQHIHVDYNFN